jgi:hypothetical protein
MILYHFTGLGALIGAEGCAALEVGKEVDLFDLAAPGSILRAGLIARKYDDWDGALRSALPPCVWLSDNSDMPAGFSSFHDFRVSLMIPSGDRRLVHWPKYFRKHAWNYDDVLSALWSEPDFVRIEAACFYAFFGDIAVDHLRKVERVEGKAA